MNIQIDGTGLVNKGAELMLYSILKEIEIREPGAYVSLNGLGNPTKIKTKLNLRRRKIQYINAILFFFHIPGILKRLHLPYNLNRIAPSKVEIVLDAGGFQFSDQFIQSLSEYRQIIGYYRTLRKNGAKIILLPQAFGPFESEQSKKAINDLFNYIDLIYVRDKVSYGYLINAGVIPKKISLYPDFTSTVKAEFPSKYTHLRKGIAIIPNYKIPYKTTVRHDEYVQYLTSIVDFLSDKGYTSFLLNHEGDLDLKLCTEVSRKSKNKNEIVTNLNALEIKGLIAESYFVISSRYHGVASALNSSIPCLATSWSHKYKELFLDFQQYDCLLDLSDLDQSKNKIAEYLEAKNNLIIRNNLKQASMSIKTKNQEMWDEIFNFINC